jgi:hypothetical protein
MDAKTKCDGVWGGTVTERGRKWKHLYRKSKKRFFRSAEGTIKGTQRAKHSRAMKYFLGLILWN